MRGKVAESGGGSIVGCSPLGCSFNAAPVGGGDAVARGVGRRMQERIEGVRGGKKALRTEEFRKARQGTDVCEHCSA